MRTPKFNFAALLLCSFALILAGCATSGPQNPPTATEQKFFTIETNYVPVVETRTSEAGTPVTVTNFVPEYVFLPNTNAAGIAATTGGITGLGAPGYGALATAVVSGIFGLWGMLRSRRSNQTAATLAQIIETGEQVLLTTPNGAALAQQWKAWMIKHQAETDTIGQASQLVANIVDTEDARQAAAQILALLEKAKS